MSTITKAITGAHTIGSLTVSTNLAANTETYDLGDDSDCSPPCAAGVFFVGSLPVEFSARSRIVIGTTVRLMTRLPSAIGAAAVSAASALMLTGRRRTIRENRNTTP